MARDVSQLPPDECLYITSKDTLLEVTADYTNIYTLIGDKYYHSQFLPGDAEYEVTYNCFTSGEIANWTSSYSLVSPGQYFGFAIVLVVCLYVIWILRFLS